MPRDGGSAGCLRVLTYERLLGRVWGGKADDGVRPLRTIVGKLRRKLVSMLTIPPTSSTEPRVGYRMLEGEGVEKIVR